MSSGEEKAWEILASLEPDDVCNRVQVSFDRSAGIYALESFGMNIHVSPQDKKISSPTSSSETFLQRFSYFSIPSILWYLINAKDIPLSGQLVKPLNLRGGELFFKGSHVLPLDKVAERYANNDKDFLEKGFSLGGERQDYGDASLRLFPLPKIPVILILWKADKEFPARVDLLFDSTCELHLPLDIIWSIAMISLLIML